MVKEIVKKAYLDSNILIALFLRKDTDKKTKINKSKIIRILFNDFKKNKQFKLCTSNWSLIETFKILTGRKKVNAEKVYSWIQDIYSTHKIKGIDVEILRLKENYSVEDLFADIKHNMVDFTKLHLADNLHVLIMKKKRVKHILTFEKEGFEQIPIVIQIDPVKLAEKIMYPATFGKFILGKSRLA